ncbi:sigma-70 family RNA polymerase sigma factor [Mycolicibacterium sp. CR10]|uniref:sigma-70 family RNA polymerase sigma factor n=1 Tax=Mycolicibacterium sp. CR10 TaxID=2562314 RepID=UPI001F0EE5FA|nr:sigma-70 family RNA polymerase sigma factor [Mycolicibacterium sp. CR10]
MTTTTLTSLPCATLAVDADLAARFARDVPPFKGALLRGARRLTKSEADAEDLLQDTLLRAYSGFHTFQEGSNLQAWLFKILYNKWVSGYRARQCRPVEATIDAINERELARTATGSAEAEALEELGDTEVASALAALPEGFAEVLYYAVIQGYTYVETAEILDIPLGTVMSRVSRGKQRLRLAFAHRAPRNDVTAPRWIA